MNWIHKKWPSKSGESPLSTDDPTTPLVRSAAGSLRTDKALSIVEEKNELPTIRVNEVIKGIDRQRTSEFKWPIRRRGTRRASDVEALEQDRLSLGQK